MLDDAALGRYPLIIHDYDTQIMHRFSYSYQGHGYSWLAVGSLYRVGTIPPAFHPRS